MIEKSTVAVVGAGTMGVGIAVTVARADYRVVLVDVDEAHAQEGLSAVREYFEESVRRGKMTTSERDEAQDRVSSSSSLKDLAASKIVIEAISENLPAKAQLISSLEVICGTETIFHTNTSTIPVTSIASHVRRPSMVIGTHYCNPAPLMSLVEVACASQTSDETVEVTVKFLRSLGKEPIVLKDTPGLLTNFLLVPFENDCIRALEAGLGSVEELDLAVTVGAGFPMGVFRLLDIVGLDVHQAVSMSLYEQFRDPRFAPPSLVDRMIAAGELGRKTLRGFYDYALHSEVSH